jgi:8-oxo-dGTP pyrophosphatase MutT (NUDIX family)
MRGTVFEPRILLRKKFHLSDVRVVIEDDEWCPDSEYDRHASAAWAERMEFEAKRNGEIWDGINYRVANALELDSAPGPISFRLGRVRYRYIATFRSLFSLHQAHGLEPLHHLSTAAMLRTKDGFYVFGRRRIDGSVDLIGGGAQADELPISAGCDLEANLEKEIFEETGLPRSHLVRQAGIGILRSQTSNVLIISDVETSLGRDALEDVFKGREDDEMARLEFVPRSEINPYLFALDGYRPLIPALMAGLA